jgi:hypothetical protein
MEDEVPGVKITEVGWRALRLGKIDLGNCHLDAIDVRV